MKHLLENQEFRLNEILFENRNKQYGAYVLRNESDRILTKALFIGVSLLAAVSITPMLISAFKTVEPTPEIFELPPPINIVDVPDNPAVILPPKATSSPAVKTVDDRLPEPKANPIVEKVVEKIEGAVSGVKNNNEGVVAPPNTYVPTTPTISSTGPIAPPAKPPVIEVPKDPNAIEVAAVQANFEGGIDAFRNKVINKFDGSGFVDEGTLSTTITFIVETNGTISDIKTNGKDASFNAEAIRTIKAIKGKWIPGKNKKGEAVRSYFKFPISMKFDN
ncbi:MAG: energy transducer TonB [Chryseobacterium sp.]|jgi:protein TonB|nr:energy transducer TonB [Chryseobacterium sp.]